MSGSVPKYPCCRAGLRAASFGFPCKKANNKTSQESAFASSDDTVVAALPVLKKSFISGVGSVAKRFVSSPDRGLPCFHPRDPSAVRHRRSHITPSP